MQNSFDSGLPRLSSVSCAVIIPPTDEVVGSDFGDFHFRAPEMIKQIPYTKKVDCWSYGVALYYCLTLDHPFKESSSQTLE